MVAHAQSLRVVRGKVVRGSGGAPITGNFPRESVAGDAHGVHVCCGRAEKLACSHKECAWVAHAGMCCTRRSMRHATRQLGETERSNMRAPTRSVTGYARLHKDPYNLVNETADRILVANCLVNRPYS